MAPRKFFLAMVFAACYVGVALPGCAPSDDGKGGGGDTGTGAEQIVNAGTLPVQEDSAAATGSTTTEVVRTTPKSVTETETYTCVSTPYSEVQTRDISARPVFKEDANTIYPGALIQGASFAQGTFAPITIPRAGGVIFMSGVSLGQGASYQRTLSTISAPAVKDAIEDILTANAVLGTAANITLVRTQTYSPEHIFFALGVDARFGSDAIAAVLDPWAGGSPNKNYVIMQFLQIYYDVFFEHPETSTSLFKDGADFSDDENQISPGNPPLYVSRVGFGRQVFLLAESEQNAEDVTAALAATSDAQVSGSATAPSGISFSTILGATKIYLNIRGGNAALATLPATGAEVGDMFDQIQEFITGSGAEYSAESPGVPVVYTLNYLSTREVARTSYSADYTRKDCATATNLQPATFRLNFSNADDRLKVYLNNSQIGDWTDGASHSLDLPSLGPWGVGDNEIRVDLFNDGCFATSLNVSLIRNGSQVYGSGYSDYFDWNFGACYGLTARYRFRANPTSGNWNLLEAYNRR